MGVLKLFGRVCWNYLAVNRTLAELRRPWRDRGHAALHNGKSAEGRTGGKPTGRAANVGNVPNWSDLPATRQGLLDHPKVDGQKSAAPLLLEQKNNGTRLLKGRGGGANRLGNKVDTLDKFG